MVVTWTAVLDGGGDGLRPFPVDNGGPLPTGKPPPPATVCWDFCLGNSEQKKPELQMRPFTGHRTHRGNRFGTSTPPRGPPTRRDPPSHHRVTPPAPHPQA